MVCVLIRFGCYLVCKKHYSFMASYSLDHYFNKHFQRIVEKLRENVIPSQNVNETKLQKSIPYYHSMSPPYVIPEFLTTRCCTLCCENKCTLHTASSI